MDWSKRAEVGIIAPDSFCEWDSDYAYSAKGVCALSSSRGNSSGNAHLIEGMNYLRQYIYDVPKRNRRTSESGSSNELLATLPLGIETGDLTTVALVERN